MFNLLNLDLLDLDDPMSLTFRFHKTDPKDSVYAVLGLIRRDVSESEQQADLLRVDYTRPLADIVRDATRFALAGRRSGCICVEFSLGISSLARLFYILDSQGRSTARL